MKRVETCSCRSRNDRSRARAVHPPQISSRTPAATAAAVRSDAATQVQLDLEQMDGLVNNMAAQVGFIRDTNMSILLNTNVRLWRLLLRDLRLQLAEQQRHADVNPGGPAPGTRKPR